MKQITEQEALLRLSALCAQGEHCQWEMLEKMRQWQVDDEAQARIMQRLVKDRYVDDERFARAFVKDKIRYNKWGRRKVEQALWQKHIDDDLRRQVLDEVDSEEYLSVLCPLLQQKQKELERTTRSQSSALTSRSSLITQKLIRFALGRGFTYDLIRQCLDVADDDFPADADED
ncbi:MAG: RecX family transcriptional regulator [Prevotella sp.]|nr:RecX family transcriptional regulator [Prevotella sp.]